MVRDDYTGFYNYPMNVLIERSENIEKLMNCELFSLDAKRIGMYTYWESYAKPILREMKGWRRLVVENC